MHYPNTLKKIPKMFETPPKIATQLQMPTYVMPRMYEHVAPVVLIANPWQVEADCLISAIRSYNQQQRNHTYYVLH